MWTENKICAPDAIAEYEYALCENASIILKVGKPRSYQPTNSPTYEVSMAARETGDGSLIVRHVAFVKADSVEEAKAKAMSEAIHYASACSAFWTRVLGLAANAVQTK